MIDLLTAPDTTSLKQHEMPQLTTSDDANIGPGYRPTYISFQRIMNLKVMTIKN